LDKTHHDLLRKIATNQLSISWKIDSKYLYLRLFSKPS